MKISIGFATLVPVLLLCLSLPPTIPLAFNHGNFTAVLCNPTERDALLKLKHDLIDPSNRFASWVGDGDCCRWYGIVRHSSTGHVIELNLRSLSFQEYDDAFPDAAPRDYEDYMRLFFLGGMIPRQLGNLSNLHYLNLDVGYYPYESYVENLDWVSGLSSLEFLDLSGLNLEELDPFGNRFNSSIPNWLYGFSRLELLNLRFNNLQGEVSSAIENMTSLIDLKLSGKKLEFNRGIPASFKSFVI
ncbi:unnamed protein product [Dovyalis caffra]|uniref:Leucine-rich repeat-containing N-terminal plant-type domain-containing protein n=1 Tax=Dovyalis caffra TaxID=77055 RepID=A0AAV1RKB3_9ROSI|nr:unnamed protein product [Dovyalis caffra]